MKHIFIINPKAGHKSPEEYLENALKKYEGKLDYEIHVTKTKEDGKKIVSDYLKEHNDEKVRFYAAGGDGTFYDLVNGADLSPRVEYASLALGSGNDFVKGFTNYEGFSDVDKMINGKVEKIDVIEVNGHYYMNIGNFGFDGKVVYNTGKIKRWPLMTGKSAYLIAAAATILGKINSKMKVVIDGKEVKNGKVLLAAVGNGCYCGGSFLCTPHAEMNDGLIDVCLVNGIHKYQLASLMKVYRNGQHLKDKRTKKLMTYYHCHTLEISSDKDIVGSLDGEVMLEKNFRFRIVPSAISVVIPQDSDIRLDPDKASLDQEVVTVKD